MSLSTFAPVIKIILHAVELRRRKCHPRPQAQARAALTVALGQAGMVSLLIILVPRALLTRGQPSVRRALGTRMAVDLRPISFPEHARSQVKGGHSSGEIELIHVEFST